MAKKRSQNEPAAILWDPLTIQYPVRADGKTAIFMPETLFSRTRIVYCFPFEGMPIRCLSDIFRAVSPEIFLNGSPVFCGKE